MRRSDRIQAVAGSLLAALGLVHILLTFVGFDRPALDALWFFGSGVLVALVGALNVVLARIPDRVFLQVRDARALVLGANVAGLLLAIAFMAIAGVREPQGPLLLLLFGTAATAQWRRGVTSRGGAELFGTGPVLPVTDVHAAVAFYRDVLGFHVDFELENPPSHASVTRCGVGIQFTHVDAAAVRTPYAGWTYLFVNDIDALHAEFVSRDATVTQSLGSRSHGMREFEIRDLSGHRLRFGQYLTERLQL